MQEHRKQLKPVAAPSKADLSATVLLLLLQLDQVDVGACSMQKSAR
jgi:hypothetical protein